MCMKNDKYPIARQWYDMLPLYYMCSTVYFLENLFLSTIYVLKQSWVMCQWKQLTQIDLPFVGEKSLYFACFHFASMDDVFTIFYSFLT